MTSTKQQQWHRADFHRRRAAGICCSCEHTTDLNPTTGRRYVRCATHQAMARVTSSAHANTARNRWVAAGCCRDCGVPCAMNVHAGQPYRRCFACRVANAARLQRYRAQRQAGRAA